MHTTGLAGWVDMVHLENLLHLHMKLLIYFQNNVFHWWIYSHFRWIIVHYIALVILKSK